MASIGIHDVRPGRPVLRISTFSLIAMLMLATFTMFAMPEFLDDLLTIGSLHIQYVVIGFFVLSVMYVFSVRGIPIRGHAYVYLTVFEIVFMTAIGILQHGQIIFEWRILGYDVLLLGGFLAGMVLTIGQPAWRILRLVRWAYLLWLGGLLTDSLLLAFGMIDPVWPGDPRVHVWAEFICVDCILLSIPYLLHPMMQRGPIFLRGKFLGLAGLLTIVVVNFAMGARSVLLQAVATALLCLPLFIRRIPRTLLYAGVVLLSLGLAVLQQVASVVSQNYAVQRLQQTNVQDEERLLEAGFLLSAIGWHAAFGLGNGSGFISPTTRPGEDFAAYPHLSIFAPLQKGGIPAMVLFVVAPLAGLTGILFRSRSSALQQEAATSALLYTLFSCLSGTWITPYWIYFGIAVGYCFYGRSGRALQLTPGDTMGQASPCPPPR